MADESYADLLNRYRAMETDQLKDLLARPDHAAGESPASQALRAALDSRQECFPSSERPPRKREQRSATQHLGIDSNAIARPDNFFDLGGDSLKVSRVVVAFQRTSGVRLEGRRMIFECLGQLAHGIELPADGAAAELAAEERPKGWFRSLFPW